jgi:superfamily I DNA/RNA helicase
MAEARRLDPTQRAAAADAPVQLTLAGPGAGKTTTLAVRFVHLVRQGVDPRRILAVTFTRKAAIEMQDHIVRQLVPERQGCSTRLFTAISLRPMPNAWQEKLRILKRDTRMAIQCPTP